MKSVIKNSEIFQAEYEILQNAAAAAHDSGLAGNPILAHYEKLLSGYRKLLDQSVRLVTISDAKQEYLFKLQNDLQNILDNIGQGILTVDEELVIHRGYSAECEAIFGRRIDGERFTALLGPDNDAATMNLLESILKREFFDGDDLKKQVLQLLLPTELTVRDRVFAAQYKPITIEFKDRTENAFMIILADITEKKTLERKMAAETTLFKAVTRIVADMPSFTACIREYRDFIRVKLPLLVAAGETPVSERIRAIFREVHTLKGNFAIFEIPWLVDLLEKVEDSLAAYRDRNEPVSWEEVRRMMTDYPFETVLNESLERLRALIGDGWNFDRDFIMMDLEEFKAVEREARLLSPELAAMLSKMRYRTVARLLAAYPEYTVKLAERLGKKIAPFTIEAEEAVSVDAEKYEGFFRSLVHVFRNLADHGIELPEERTLAGKDPAGNVRCAVTRGVAEFTISIRDDGRGIDLGAIRACAVAKNLISDKAASALSPRELAALIFSDGLSTAAPGNGISGRGVGLAAVRRESELLGGTIEVTSSPGQGTHFMFHLPCQ